MMDYPTAFVTNTHKNDDELSFSCTYKHSQEWWWIIKQLYTHKNDDGLSYSCSDTKI